MRVVNCQTPVGQALWKKHVRRQTGASDPNYIRRDPVTLRIFGKPCSAREAAGRILEDIRRQGDRALCRYSFLLDGFKTSAPGLAVSTQEKRRAVKQVPAAVQRSIKEAAEHIRAFHQSQLRKKTGSVRRPGCKVSERRFPLRRVGMYVPGGVAPLISTVLMNALPAKVAGVPEVYMATPPGRQG
ncbi:histidinol dehydrogenase, partial [candidate division FCPU426 bacterium]|nr:histidinol dehydrogenase [candidate division FCPU426 bacterium]